MGFLILIAIAIIIIIVIASRKKEEPLSSNLDNQNIPLPEFATRNPETGEINLEFKFENSVHEKGIFLIIDTETTGLPKDKNAKPEEIENWPRILQICWMLFDLAGNKIDAEDCYLKQEKPIPAFITNINGIDDKIIAEKGEEPKEVWERFIKVAQNCEYVVAHNIDFDIPIIESELLRNGFKKQFSRKKKLCTMEIGKSYCKIPRNGGRGYKYPKLEELFRCLFFPTAKTFVMPGLHNAWIDTNVTAKCFFKLFEEDFIKL